MRALVSALIALFVVAACEPIPTQTQPQSPQARGPVTARPAPQPVEPVVIETLTPPETQSPDAAGDADLPPPDSPMLAQQRASCTRAGGQMTPRGAGLYACVMPTQDAGQSCNAAADCEGICLARSGTCAPIAPLFGCQEVYTLEGRRETLCVD